MNPEAQERLEELLKLDPASLNAEQKAFLRARRTYLKESQEEEYASVLDEKEVAVEEGNQEGEQPAVSYPQLLARAKELGYTGGRVKRPVLEQFITNAEEEQKKQNPFN